MAMDKNNKFNVEDFLCGCNSDLGLSCNTTGDTKLDNIQNRTLENGCGFASGCGCNESSATGPVAVVVGGSSGIGLATAIRLSKSGYTVYNLSRRSADICNLCVPTLHSIPCDVESDCDVSEAIGSVLRKEKHIDVLVYSAGISLAAPLEHTTETDFRRIFEVNYFGFIKALWQVLPLMRKARQGRIVVVSSLAGSCPIPFDSAYSAAKASLDITVRTLAQELKPFNIKLTAIAPGGVATNFTFKRKRYPLEVVGEYADAMDKATTSLALIEQKGLDPHDVGEAIVELLKAKRPKCNCGVGISSKAVGLMQKILPTSLGDMINARVYK